MRLESACRAARELYPLSRGNRQHDDRQPARCDPAEAPARMSPARRGMRTVSETDETNNEVSLKLTVSGAPRAR